MRRFTTGLIIAVLLVLAVTGAAWAQSGLYTCNITIFEGRVQLDCALQTAPDPTATPTNTPLPADTPTATPAATPVPPTATPVPLPTNTPAGDMTDSMWHAPGAHGDRPAHEHGDPVPAWVTAAGYMPMYTHNHATPGETTNTYWKHTGFKGWAGRFSDGQDWYWIAHLDVNPGGQNSRFHSYQLWVKDATGAVSHFSGWMDFGTGNNAGPQKIVTCGTDSGIRPIIMVNAAAPCTAVRFENWYGRGNGGWTPDMGFNINPNYRDAGSPTDPTTWQSINGQPNNLTRRIEFAWYASRSSVRGTFVSDQFGRVIAGGLSDPACSSQVSVGGNVYNIVCATQVIQPTLQTIQFPGNSVQRTFPGAGVVLPN